jgi:hypothetical protein
MNMDNLILIGVPNGSGNFPAIMVSSLLQLKKPCPCAFMVVERQMIEKARNVIALEALKNNCTHLLFVDDDNPIPPETLELMLADDKDVVIAPILTRVPDANGKYGLCAFYKKEVDGIRLYENIEQFTDDGYLHKIDAGGTGCMLIKRKVLEKVNRLYAERMFERTRFVFDKPITVNGKEYTERTMSEDVEFPLLPSTNILGTDYKWKQLKDYKIGDSLFGVDEFATTMGIRKLNEAKVVDIVHKKLPLWKITTEFGEVTTTADHKWLYKKGNGAEWYWERTDKMKAGKRISMPVKNSSNPNTESDDYKKGYIVGNWSGDEIGRASCRERVYVQV